jgi:hypothetical protein
MRNDEKREFWAILVASIVITLLFAIKWGMVWSKLLELIN